MRIIISPAKKMNVDTDSLPWKDLPYFLEKSERLCSVLRGMSEAELKRLWKCNDSIAALNIDRLRKITSKPMIVKLTPNVTDIAAIARAAAESGADALSLINTLVGMRIDIRTGEPIIANRTGGVSGPCVFPVALGCVWRVRQALPDIPIIGIGGIDSGEKALEFLYAGANAVEVGAAALYDPTAPMRVARELDDLLDSRPELAAKLAAGQTWR